MRAKETLWCGLRSQSTISAGAVERIFTRPQIYFRGERLLVWDQCASYFLIRSITVGMRENLVSLDPLPASAFATRMDKLARIDEIFKRDGVITISVDKTGAEMLGNPITLPTASPGCDISMIVENLAGHCMYFHAAFMGSGVS